MTVVVLFENVIYLVSIFGRQFERAKDTRYLPTLTLVANWGTGVSGCLRQSSKA
jgi:hypothetical protein